MRNLDDEASPRSLAGSLLVAHPNMLDPNFRRTVLFISAHEPDEGALGVILNRPLDKQVADLVAEMPPENLADVPVFIGGPVGRNQLMFAAFEWQKGEGLKLNHNVNVDEASERVVTDPASIRAFVGYAGWGAGQLEAEMQHNGWLNCPADPSLIFDSALDSKYERAFRKAGIDLGQLSSDAGNA